MTIDQEKQRLTNLARRLAAATSAREAKWGIGDDGVYIWTAKEGAVTIVSRDRDDEPPYELAVFTPNSERVDELTSALLDNDRPAPWNEALVELYRAARRSALRADDIIDALVAGLPSGDSDGDSEGSQSLLGRALGSRTTAGDAT
jgi:hypothetical protein